MDACIEWTGAIDRDGYGKCGRGLLAHRVAYERERGPIPPGMEIDHICRNRRCVNVGHLEVVTHAVNCYRGESLPAKNAGKLFCDNGHRFDRENTYWRRQGGRDCRACGRDASRRYRQRKAAA